MLSLPVALGMAFSAVLHVDANDGIVVVLKSSEFLEEKKEDKE